MDPIIFFSYVMSEPPYGVIDFRETERYQAFSAMGHPSSNINLEITPIRDISVCKK